MARVAIWKMMKFVPGLRTAAECDVFEGTGYSIEFWTTRCIGFQNVVNV